MSLVLIVLLPFIGSCLAALLPANARNWEAWLAGLIALACVALSLSHLGVISEGEVVRYQLAWAPEYGLDLSFRMDAFAWLFSLLVSGIGVLVVLYARYYMSPEDPVPRFFSFLLAFMGAMLGVVLSGNLIQLVLFWELTSLTSFMLIGYWHHRADARRGARMAFTVTATGGLALFAGMVILGQVVGSYELDDVLAAGDLVRAHSSYHWILGLVALGALTKSAQFPFHFWLPRAMAAPTPVSAYLHSATMVKAGVFLLVRFWPVLAGTEAWSLIIGGAGLATLVIGSFLAIFQHDLKGLLAYSTISHLGLITLLLGIGTPLAAGAAIFHILNHATFKASLFMAAGIIDHETGTRDLRLLGGLWRSMPITASLAMVAAGAMAGVPLLNGFLSKEMFFAETVQVSGGLNWGLPLLATLAALFTVIYSLRFIHQLFFGTLSPELPRTPHEPPHWMRLPIELLVLVCLVVGVLPALTVGAPLHLAVVSVLGDATPDYSLSVWHGFNLPLIMSLIALGGGVLVYGLLERFRPINTLEKVPLLHRFDGQRGFERVLMGLTALAGRINRRLTSRRLQVQLMWLVLAALVAGLLPSLRGVANFRELPIAIDPAFAMLWLIGGVCAVAAAYQAKYHRLAALALLGGAGLVTCVTFAWFSAPDLALTQLAVEVVTTVLILLGLRWLPRRLEPQELGIRASLRDRVRRFRDFLIALATGGGMALLAYLVLTRETGDSIAEFFLQRALPEGGGTNVVNVILVDFRGFDTLGEIAVLGIVALTVYALLRRFRPAPESILLPQQKDDPDTYTPAEDALRGDTMVPGLFMRALMPVLMVMAIYLFMRGHNLPGGGFVAGLVMSVAIILQYMVGGTVWVEENLPIRPHIWIGSGLLLALFTGLGAWVFGFPFLTSHSPHPVLPLLGEVPLPSAFLFDLGVFLLVVGATVLMLIALGHQSVRSHRTWLTLKASEGAADNNRKGALPWN
ncbi:monovalent cation/H+ antiporter subunit A [Alcanivorax quisquiliarum]|uniref:Monovalent cation/H+ antiporter subunit A n=1 Tax=Alcanivorax quisquiliarum TaxID=2933565 RepID=A0ABT0E8B5_9GAMM|nr:monovalent cation/H+ antiporter subunit A [Alcanivorax quisquiliarum]MCK0538061.1 monovalent cation/H+ antiporter subunit A [Alcanivorax quisquiliarum]